MVTYKVYFVPKEASDGTYYIRMYIALKKQGRHEFSLPIKCSKKDWNNGEPKSRTIKAAMASYRSMADEVISRYDILEHRAPLMSEVVRDFDERRGSASSEVKESTSAQLIVLLKSFMASEGSKRNWAVTTYGNFRSLLNYVSSFAPNVTISQINDDWLQSFVVYLREQKRLSNLTINRVIASFRWFLRWGSAHGHYYGKSHESFRPKFKGCAIEARDIIYLTRSELEQMASVDLSAHPPTWSLTRDLFVFCCFTGLRFSDVSALRKSDVFSDCIKVITKKTNDSLVIDLNKHSRALLAKYAGTDGDRVFPYISNCHVNMLLKAIGKLAGVTNTTRYTHYTGNERHEEHKPKCELLTFHCARRTFVVMALELGIAPEVIMKWTGHSNYDAMKPYIAIVDDLKRRSMDKFDLL